MTGRPFLPLCGGDLKTALSPGQRLVARAPVGAAPLLQLRLVHMAAARDQLLADSALVGAEDLPVGLVELLDDLERPAPRRDVAAQQVGADLLLEVRRAACAQQLQRLVELEVRLADELVEAIQVPSGALDRLERLRHLSGGGDRLVRCAGRAQVLAVGF